MPRLPADLDEALARDLAGLGVRVLTTHFQPTPEAVAGEPARRVRGDPGGARHFDRAGTGYNPQLTHPDDAVLAAELERLARGVRHRARLGSEMIISGCGSRHPTHFYGPHPDNHTPATRERLIASLRRVVPFAEATGVIAGAGVPRHDRARHARAHSRDHRRGRFALGARQLRPGQPARRFSAKSGATLQAMRHMWETLGACYTKSAHIKDVVADADFVVHISEAAPGEGFLDLDAYFDVCTQLGEDTAVIVEHLPADKARAAIDYVKQAAKQRGHTFA